MRSHGDRIITHGPAPAWAARRAEDIESAEVTQHRFDLGIDAGTARPSGRSPWALQHSSRARKDRTTLEVAIIPESLGLESDVCEERSKTSTSRVNEERVGSIPRFLVSLQIPRF